MRSLVAWLRMRRLWAGAAAAVLCLTVSVGLGAPDTSPSVAAMASGVSDPLSVLDGRSPGLRAVGALVQTKLSRVAALLPHVRRRPYSVSIAVPPAQPLPSPQTFDPGPFDEGSVGLGGGALPLVGGIDVAGPLGEAGLVGFPPVVTSGVGVIGGGGDVAPPVTGPVVPPASPVPEPSTWAMLILGFGMIGLCMRRRAASAIHA